MIEGTASFPENVEDVDLYDYLNAQAPPGRSNYEDILIKAADQAATIAAERVNRTATSVFLQGSEAVITYNDDSTSIVPISGAFDSGNF